MGWGFKDCIRKLAEVSFLAIAIFKKEVVITADADGDDLKYGGVTFSREL